jgi:hypothetical protein
VIVAAKEMPFRSSGESAAGCLIKRNSPCAPSNKWQELVGTDARVRSSDACASGDADSKTTLRPIRRIANRRKPSPEKWQSAARITTTIIPPACSAHRYNYCWGFWFYSFLEKVYGSVIILYSAAHTRIARSEWSTRNFSHSTYAIKKLSPTVQVSSPAHRLLHCGQRKASYN